MKKHKKKTNKKKTKKSSVAQPFWPFLCLTVLTIIVFFPSFSADFVNWDDPDNLYENPDVLNFGLQSIKNIFTQDVIGNYNPLPILMFSVEHKLFGLNPKWFHIINILFHIANVLLVYRLFGLLKITHWGALFGAALFAIHPMHVESVAWITERKDVLFAFFFLLSSISYLKYRQNKIKKHWYFSLFYFFIGLFAKIQMVSLPLSLVAYDYLFDRKFEFKRIVHKWPFFLGALCFGLLGIWLLQEAGSLDEQASYHFGQRLIIGGYALMVYLAKFVWPYELSALYPYPAVLPGYFYIAAVMAVGVLLGGFYLFLKKKVHWVFGLFFFFANIVFLLQILNAGQGLTADRFSYVSYLGLIYILAYYFSKHTHTSSRYRRALFLSAGVYLSIFAFRAHKQTKTWDNSATLWTQVIKYYDNATTPYTNRANHYRDIGKKDLAMQDYNKAISLDPKQSSIYNSRAKLLFANQAYLESIQDYTKGLSIDPDNVEMLVNRGAAYAATGQYEIALRDIDKAVKIDPKQKNAYLNRSLIYQRLEMFDQAIEDIDRYLGLDPNHANLWYEKARLLYFKNRQPEALAAIDQAIKLKSIEALFHYQRALICLKSGQRSKAVEAIERAKQLGKTDIDQSLLNQIYQK